MFDLVHPHDRFRDLIRIVPTTCAVRDELMNRMLGRDRLYHGAIHLSSMWSIHQALRKRYDSCSYLQDSDQRIAAAIGFHDAVYDARIGSPANEQASADFWSKSAFGVSAATREWVSEAILATSEHLTPRRILGDDDKLREWFVGLDLCALAAPWDMFLLNNRLIRLEHSHVTDAEWSEASGSFLQRLANAERIFSDPLLSSVFEEGAKTNLAKYLAAHV